MTKFLRRAKMSDAAWDLALLAIMLAIGDAIAGVFAGIGYRLELWDYRDGIGALRYVFWLAVAICVGSLVALAGGLYYRRPGAIACGSIALLIAATTAYVPWNLREQLGRVPPIHDISTDTANPPQYVHAATTRKKGEHPVAYDGPEVAAQQKKAFPDIQPLVVKAPAFKVFRVAESVLAGMGLEIVEADPAQGRIEAVDRSLLFGFGDDIVVRIASGPDGNSVVDVRSKSRVGRSDFGVNATRIRVFTRTLAKQLGTDKAS